MYSYSKQLCAALLICTLISTFCFAEPSAVEPGDLYLHQDHNIELYFELNDHGTGPFDFTFHEIPTGSTLSSNGIFTWETPILGQHSIEFNAVNAANTTKVYSFYLNIGDEPPVAVDDSIAILEDSDSITINVLSNDFDLNGDLISASNLSTSSLGTTTFTNDGILTFTPHENVFGTETLSYSITAYGVSRHAEVSIDIQAINDPPVINLQPIPSLHLPGGEKEYRIDDWIFSIHPGPMENTQVLNIELNLIAGENLFYSPPQLSDDQDLIFTPKLNATGNAILHLFVQDNGGVENSGSDNIEQNIVIDFKKIGQEHIGLQTNNFITAIRNHPNDFKSYGRPKTNIVVIQDQHPYPQGPFHGMFQLSFDLDQSALDSSSIVDVYMKRNTDQQKLKIAEIDLSQYPTEETQIQYFWNSRLAKFDWNGEAIEDFLPVVWTLNLR